MSAARHERRSEDGGRGPKPRATSGRGRTDRAALRAAGVDFLEHRHRRGRGGAGRRGACAGEAAAQEELFVFFVELENLEDAGAGVFELGADLGIAGGAGGEGAEGGERGIQFFEHLAFALEKIGAGGALVLT